MLLFSCGVQSFSKKENVEAPKFFELEGIMCRERQEGLEAQKSLR